MRATGRLPEDGWQSGNYFRALREKPFPRGGSQAPMRCPGFVAFRNEEGKMEAIVIWLVVGLIAGWLASAIVGGGYGLVGDIVVGIVGTFIGGFVFRALRARVPFHGIAGMIAVAFVGAVLLLIVLRAVGSSRRIYV